MPTKREEEAESLEEITDSEGEPSADSAFSSSPSAKKPAEPDWYADPGDPDIEWYWDGSEWTDKWRRPDDLTEEATPAEIADTAETSEAPPPVQSGRPDIDRAARRMALRMGSRREIKRLPRHLHEGEIVDDMARGAYGGGTGLLVLTSERLFFLRDGWTGAAHEDFPLERVTTVGFVSKFGSGTISIHASGNTTEISGVVSSDGKRLTAAARKLVGPRPANPVPAIPSLPAEPSPAVDPMDQLKKLGELRDSGVLTAEEFEDKKKSLLDRL